VKGEVREKN